MKIKYDLDLMKFISLFESLTNANVKDCISHEDMLIFIVDEGQIGKAVGKNGVNVKRLSNMLKKKLKIVEFNSNKLQFIKNYIYPLKASDIQEENNIITITGPDTKTKGLLIGRNAKNLNDLKNIVRRFFEFEDIKVV